MQVALFRCAPAGTVAQATHPAASGQLGTGSAQARHRLGHSIGMAQLKLSQLPMPMPMERLINAALLKFQQFQDRCALQSPGLRPELMEAFRTLQQGPSARQRKDETEKEPKAKTIGVTE